MIIPMPITVRNCPIFASTYRGCCPSPFVYLENMLNAISSIGWNTKRHTIEIRFEINPNSACTFRSYNRYTRVFESYKFSEGKYNKLLPFSQDKLNKADHSKLLQIVFMFLIHVHTLSLDRQGLDFEELLEGLVSELVTVHAEKNQTVRKLCKGKGEQL